MSRGGKGRICQEGEEEQSFKNTENKAVNDVNGSLDYQRKISIITFSGLA